VTAPQRIQQRRTKGWRKPEGAVAVGRGTKWGNPFRIERVGCAGGGFRFSIVTTEVRSARVWRQHIGSQLDARREAVALFALHVGPMGNYEYDDETLQRLRRDLAGKDLMCWCPLNQPCHADVLLELANPTPPPPGEEPHRGA
jgi:hypothetical protein